MAEDFHLEYYSNVSIDCDESKHNFTNAARIENRYWLLPNGSLVDNTTTNKQLQIGSNFNLTILKIIDSDFGYYFCLLIRSDHTVDRIVHSLNIDGAYYGDLLEKFKRNAIIGGIAAGTLFVAVAGCCLVWQLRYQKREQKNKAVDELDKAIDGFDLKAYDNVGLEDDDAEIKKGGTPKTNGPNEKDDQM
jgi:hypothetical protein